MIKGYWFHVLSAIAMCGLLALCSGCGMFGGDKGADGLDTVEFEELNGDTALYDRFELGRPVTGVRFDPVHFAYDSFQVMDSEAPKIERVAEYMRSHPQVRLVVDGHCDERGSREYNVSLGEHRALAVRAYVVGLGVDGSRVQTRSFGEEVPLDPGHSESAWRANRRAEFSLFE